jgi:hypothetical protein
LIFAPSPFEGIPNLPALILSATRVEFDLLGRTLPAIEHRTALKVVSLDDCRFCH